MGRVLLLLFLVHLVFPVNSAEYKIDSSKSTVKWHLFISKGTNVYAEVPVSGSFNNSEEKQSGELSFDMLKAKSYELDGSDKDYSNTRDSRIFKITGANKNLPKFIIKSVAGLSGEQASSITGDLLLNGVKKEITITGKVNTQDNKLNFVGDYELIWKEYKIADPIMWFMKIANKADSKISLKFNIITE